MNFVVDATPEIGLDHDAILASDLDCDGYGIRNAGAIHALNLVEQDDPRLYDARMMLPGSVYDLHVFPPPLPPPPPMPGDSPIAPPPETDHRIVQSKLNLNGNCPANYLSLPPPAPDAPSPTRAARGDLYQPVDQKGFAYGYASLDSAAKIPIGQVPTLGGGTLRQISLKLPVELYLVSPAGADLSGAVVFNVGWSGAPALSWFGTSPLDVTGAPPRFVRGFLPASLVPGLDGTIFTSGLFDRNRLPVAIGVGTAPPHGPGMVPDPGESGDPTDFLGRDMLYHPMRTEISYQPRVTEPYVVILSMGEVALGGADITGATSPDAQELRVQIYCNDNTALIMYRINKSGFFKEYSGETIFLNPGDTVETFTMKVGYNSSAFVYYTYA
jgi:hypothetical protein